MSEEETLTKMNEMRLGGMASAFRELLADAPGNALSWTERVGLMTVVDRAVVIEELGAVPAAHVVRIAGELAGSHDLVEVLDEVMEVDVLVQRRVRCRRLAQSRRQDLELRRTVLHDRDRKAGLLREDVVDLSGQARGQSLRVSCGRHGVTCRADRFAVLVDQGHGAHVDHAIVDVDRRRLLAHVRFAPRATLGLRRLSSFAIFLHRHGAAVHPAADARDSVGQLLVRTSSQLELVDLLGDVVVELAHVLRSVGSFAGAKPELVQVRRRLSTGHVRLQLSESSREHRRRARPRSGTSPTSRSTPRCFAASAGGTPQRRSPPALHCSSTLGALVPPSSRPPIAARSRSRLASPRTSVGRTSRQRSPRTVAQRSRPRSCPPSSVAASSSGSAWAASTVDSVPEIPSLGDSSRNLRITSASTAPIAPCISSKLSGWSAAARTAAIPSATSASNRSSFAPAPSLAFRVVIRTTRPRRCHPRHSVRPYAANASPTAWLRLGSIPPANVRVRTASLL